MLVRPHYRAVEKYFLKVSIFAKLGEKRLPDAFVRPTRKAPEGRIPRPKGNGKVTPWRAGSCHPKDSFNKQTIICTVAATVPSFTLQHRLDS